MKKASICLIFVGFACSLAMAQQTNDPIVTDNIAFFEQLFTAVATAPAIHQQAYFDHLKLSQSERQVALEVAAQFQSQEGPLRQQAQAALAAKRTDMDSTLAQIRLQRSQLLVSMATKLMQQLDPDGVSRVKEYVQRVNALLPKRVGN